MKLCRLRKDSVEITGVILGDEVVPLGSLPEAFHTMTGIIKSGPSGLATIREYLDTSPSRCPLENIELLAPIERPGKYLAIGMNYGKHAEEAERLGVEVASRQTWFNKQITCISGPFDTIEPGVTEKLDYEVELAVIIGSVAKHVSAIAAKDFVFGYTVANDVSARDWQFHTSTITMGKSFDTHGPIGPWIVTADELTDPHALNLRCLVNGEVRQSGSTKNMIHNIWKQIEYLSTAFTLEPGDIIATGTPDGVGAAMQPPVFLQGGDVVRCEIDGIGVIENVVAQGAHR